MDIPCEDGGSIPLAFVVDTRRQAARQAERALLSHTRAQAEGLVEFLGPAKTIISSVVFDDASMWVQKPKDLHLDGERLRAFIRRQSMKTARGKPNRNVHLPALNVVQSLFSRGGGDAVDQLCHGLSGALVFVPTQFLPRGNYGTVFDRMRRWLVLQGTGECGEHVSAKGPAVAAALMGSTCRAQPFCHDNLVMNFCIIGHEQQAILRRLPLLRKQGVLHVLHTAACVHHSAALAMKPSLEVLDNLPSQLTKLAHLLESGRTMEDFRKKVAALVELKFVYKRVCQMPAEAGRWHAWARRTMEYSMAAGDLDEAQMLSVLSFANGDWKNKDEFVHYCCEEHCTFQCRRDENRALATAKEISLMVVGSGTNVPLLYRWKGFEKTNGYVLRASRFHGLLLQSFEKLWPRAQRQAAAGRLRPDGDIAELSYADRQKVRASAVLQYWVEDPECHRCEQAALLTRPVQLVMNDAFAAEKRSSRFSREVTTGVAGEEPPTADDEHMDTLESNFAFFSGARGVSAVQGFCRLLNDYGGALGARGHHAAA